MKLVSNSVSPNDVVEEERNGDRYLIVKDVPFVRAMNLSGGYVPEKELKESVDDWTVELTANHPRNEPGKPWYRPDLDDGVPISVNTSQTVHREYVVGEAENPRYDGTWITADMAINADIAEAMGGVAADIVEKIDNGEAFDVSSQYIPKQLPAGEYDGEHRANVEGIDQPDSIALLPHKPGQCSMEHGCGVNPEVAANAADVRVPVADDPGGEDSGAQVANKRVDGIAFETTRSGKLDESAIPSEDFEDHYIFDGRVKSESSFPVVDADGALRRGNVKAAWDLRGHGRDEERLVEILADLNDEFDEPPIDDEDLEDAMSANSSSWWGLDRIMSFLGRGEAEDSNETTGAESPTDSDTTVMKERTAELVANHGFDAENLPSEDTECFGRIYDAVTSNEDGEAEEPETETETDEESEMNDDEIVLTEDELEDMIESKAEEIVANREENTEKQQLAADIVANSAEYDDTEAVTDDFPTVAALETKKEQVSDSGTMPGSGVTPNAQDEDLDDVPSGVF